MASDRARASGRRDSYHAGLDADAVIDAAVELSRGSGLSSWSLRELAEKLGVTPAAIYHHVGGRELLSHHVVERVLTLVELPTTVMPWRQWSREALFPIRPVLAACPGAARWILLHGPVLEGLTPVIDAGIASLQQAGFGHNAAIAYGSLTNTAMMTIAAADERILHEGDAPRDHAGLIRDLDAILEHSAGVVELRDDLLQQFTGTAEQIESARDRYYRFALERVMDGLESWLAAGMPD